MVRLSRDSYNERLQEAEAARRAARNHTETGVGLTDRLAVQIGEICRSARVTRSSTSAIGRPLPVPAVHSADNRISR
ncbi:MAG: hypothetical protein R2873_23050 [Caldilineaceae bacterium]